jgi:tRNA pseudouridine55 synthase
MYRLPALEALDESARDALLLPVDRALVAMPALKLAPGQAERLLQGVAVSSHQAEPTGEVRLYSSEGEFVGLGQRDAAGLIVPRRMFPRLTLLAADGGDTQCP